jgi:pimeloyl-ACP methyl ester carboxylesterase
MTRWRISRRSVIATGVAAFANRAARGEPSVTIIRTEDGRDLRVSIWPAMGRRRGIVLFSHGALSRPEKYGRLLDPWSAAGFEILAPLHVDSTDHPDHGKYAKSADTWAPRLLDMKALAAFVDAPGFIAAGHSYGGLIALTLGGAEGDVPASVPAPLRDPRAKAVVAFSPPGVVPGKMTLAGYSGLAVPSLIQTGDKDAVVGMPDPRWEAHLAPYEAAPPGDKYALILEGVDHYFGGLICEPTKPGPPRTAQLERAVALSTDFMEAYGAGDAAALRRLDRALAASGPVILTKK